MTSKVITVSAKSNELTLWDEPTQLAEVRKIFAPKLNEPEFAAFIGLGKATGLNPFLKEIWAVKYQDNAPAQIFIGRDGYRKAAQKNPDYDYHQSEAVYSNDKFVITDGIVNHTFGLTDRGELLGAYCLVKRHGASRQTYVYVTLKEYDTGKSVWSQKKATMIKKVAEAQALRGAFQEQFSGSYYDEELPHRTYEQTQETVTMTALDRVKQSYKTRTGANNETNISNEDNYIDGIVEANNTQAETHTIDNDLGVDGASKSGFSKKDTQTEKASYEQILDIENLSHSKQFPAERMRNALNYYNVALLQDLSTDQADAFIKILNAYIGDAL